MVSENKINFSIKRKSSSGILISFLFILSFILILFNKTDYVLINNIKNIGIDVVSPITRFISSPVTIVNNVAIRLNNIRSLELKNAKLKEEISRLKKWQTLAIKNSRENRVYKSLLNSTTNEVEIIKTASVINESPGIYNKFITINAGINYNIIKDLAVINNKGLIGKIIYTSKNNSKVLLITDSNSSVPVKTLSDTSYAIMSGSSNGKYLVSTFTKENKLPKVGDLLLTSGNAKVFPRDILVGKVIKVNEDNFFALPYVDFNNLSYVQIVKSK